MVIIHFYPLKSSKKTSEFGAEMKIIKRKKDNSKDKKRINRIFSILHFFRHGNGNKPQQY